MGHRLISNTIPYLVPTVWWHNSTDFYFLKDEGYFLVKSEHKFSTQKPKLVLYILRVSELSNSVETQPAK